MPQAQSVALPKRWPLVINPENRKDSTSKDSRLVNCYTEKMPDGTYWIYKRSGLLASSQPSGGAATGRGMFNWLGDVYAVFGTTLYKSGSSVGTVNGAGGKYYFSSCLGATPKLQLGNGVKAYNYDAGAGLVEITDGDFPSAFCKGWAFLDGTTYVLKPNAGIQGDDINDPVNWDPLNVIVAQIEPDRGVALAKQLVYAVAMKQWSTEIFYDAGNATGSPLSPVQGAKVNYGCASAETVVSIDGILVWVSTNQSASIQVIMMDNLKAQIISTDPIERLLDKADFTGAVYSYAYKNIGHRFYILTIVNSNLTLVYDLDEKMWHQWTDVNGNYFPMVASTYDSTQQLHYFQHESNGRIYLSDESYYTDAGDTITVDIYTPNFDGDTNRRKQMTVMKFLTDQVPGSMLQVRNNDNDFQVGKWTNFRRVDLSHKQPMLTNCGMFVERAYNFRHQSATEFRIKGVEMQLDLGTL